MGKLGPDAIFWLVLMLINAMLFVVNAVIYISSIDWSLTFYWYAHNPGLMTLISLVALCVSMNRFIVSLLDDEHP